MPPKKQPTQFSFPPLEERIAAYSRYKAGQTSNNLRQSSAVLECKDCGSNDIEEAFVVIEKDEPPAAPKKEKLEPKEKKRKREQLTAEEEKLVTPPTPLQTMHEAARALKNVLDKSPFKEVAKQCKSHMSPKQYKDLDAAVGYVEDAVHELMIALFPEVLVESSQPLTQSTEEFDLGNLADLTQVPDSPCSNQ